MTSPLVLPSGAYLVESLPEIWFGVVLFTLAMYVVLDGIDFGIGVIYGLHDETGDRETMLSAFGPIWDANEVWLVAFGTTLLAAFPPVYSRLLADHYLLAIAIVLALLFRGIGPELREHAADETWRRRAERSFVIGSVVSPLLLGGLVGSWVFAGGIVSLPSLLAGVAVLALSVAAGGAFLAAKTSGPLRDAVDRYATYGTVAYLGAAVALLATAFVLDAAGARETLLSPPAIALVLATVVLGVAGIVLGRWGRDRARLLTTAGLGAGLVALVAVLLYPTVYPPAGLSIADAVVSPLALNLLTVLGLPVLVVVLWYFRFLYGVFAGPIDAEGYGH